MDTDTRIKALAKHLGEAPETISEARYGDNLFESGREEYLVLTDEEADADARAAILDSLWAFNAEFVQAHSKALASSSVNVIEHVRKMQEELCEDAGPLIRAMIDDLDHFVEDAIKADGRGHFLSGYDGEENEVRLADGSYLFIYRVN